MSKKSDRQLIVGLDIGTSKVAATVGEITEDGQLNIIGLGNHPSRGLKRGVVVNIEETVNSIQRAIEEAELMAGCQINSAYTGIAGSHIRSLNSHGIVAIKNKEVTQADIDRVMDAAKAVAIPADQRILHVLPQEFIIDNQGGIRDPIGMSGVRLEAKVHLVIGAVSSVQNIVKCVRRCGLDVAEISLEQLASSYAVLSNDEKELGVCLIDIGGGTTDIAIFTEGAIRHTAVIPVAGDQVTNDIAVALRTPTQSAEAIKLKFASALVNDTDDEAVIEVPGVADRAGSRLSRRALAEVIEPRYEELFRFVQNEIHNSGHADHITAGIVLTGGAAKVEGLIMLAEQVFKMPVRVGMPQYINGMSDTVNDPSYATCVGLLLQGLQQNYDPRLERRMGECLKGILNKMRSWFQGNF